MGVVPVDAVVAVARWVTPRIVISSLLPTIIRFSQVKIKVVVWPFFFFLKNPFFFENPKTYIYDEDPKLIKEKKRRVFVCVCFGFWTDKEDSLKKRPTKQRKANKRGA